MITNILNVYISEHRKDNNSILIKIQILLGVVTLIVVGTVFLGLIIFNNLIDNSYIRFQSNRIVVE